MSAMNTSDNPTVVDIADLYRRPGASRQVEFDVPPSSTLEFPLVEVDRPVHVAVMLESLVDGVLARGNVTTDAEVSCARCLEPLRVELRTDVVELFADPARVEPDDEVEEGYEILTTSSHPQIDVDMLIRDALVESMPVRPLCRPDCQGLCAQCGARLDDGDCGCAEEPVDDRWAALRDLDLPGTNS